MKARDEMNLRQVLTAMVLAMVASLGNSANASLITYTFSGVADGNLDGVSFTGAQFTFTALGDTAAVIDEGGGNFINAITSLHFDIQGVAAGTMLQQYNMFSTNSVSAVGIYLPTPTTQHDRIDVADTGLANYQLTTTTGPYSGNVGLIFFVGQFANDPTTAGDLNMFNPASVTFSAVVAPVPEPSSMVTFGIGVVGLTAAWWRRRRNQKST
jgi:hypothetical protein